MKKLVNFGYCKKVLIKKEPSVKSWKLNAYRVILLNKLKSKSCKLKESWKEYHKLVSRFKSYIL